MSRFVKQLTKSCNQPVVFGAPMNGGINNPAFAAAVIKHGAVGGFGFTYHTPELIAKDIRETRKLVQGPINANFFVFDTVETPSDSDISRAKQELQNRVGPLEDTDFKIPVAPYTPNLDVQMTAIWAEKPEILTFHFDIPKREYIAEAQRLGICVGITATSVEEAHLIQESGADFIVAQGVEAGGHRGMFNAAWRNLHGTLEQEATEGLPTVELVTQLCHGANPVSIPIVAAGGIMTGRDIFTAIQAGAVAVQLGTAFLPCLESTASAEHKSSVLRVDGPETTTTTKFSGRPARGIRNEFMDRMESAFALNFPLQNTLTSVIRSQAVRDHNSERQSLWAGSAYRKAGERASRTSGGSAYLSVGELMEQLKQEYHDCL